MFLALALAAKN